MPTYIRSYGLISPQDTCEKVGFPEKLEVYNEKMIKAIEPVYKNFIDPSLLRRMARILKMGLSASEICMDAAGNHSPDGIIVGTGLGNVDHLEKFMFSVDDRKETMLSPIPFMQSTHNQIASQISLMLKNHNYNMTYSHRAFSFEWTLLDALMLLESGKAKNILTGGIEILMESIYILYDHLNYWKTDNYSTSDFLNSQTNGTIPGEGAAFFMLSSEKCESNFAELKSVHTFYKPESKEFVENEINVFLEKQGLNSSDIDLVIFGINGDVLKDKIYYQLQKDYFSQERVQYTYYKHLCGEYFTTSAFALWMAANILKFKDVPQIVKVNDVKSSQINNVLIYNHFQNNEHSLILLGEAKKNNQPLNRLVAYNNVSSI